MGDNTIKPIGWLIIIISVISFIISIPYLMDMLLAKPKKPLFELSQEVFLKKEQIPIDTVTQKGTHDHREIEFLSKQGYTIETDFIYDKVIYREIDLTIIKTEVIDNLSNSVVYSREYVLDSVDQCEERNLAQAFIDKETRKHFVIDSINVSLNNCN